MLCTLMRWRMWRTLDENRALGRFASRHIAGCERCRRMAEKTHALDRNLRMGALAAPTPDPAAFCRPTPAGGRWRPLALACGLLASAAVLVLLVTGSPNPAPRPTTADQSAEFLTSAKRIEQRAATLWREVADADPLRRPLSRELDNLRRDAKHGFRYVLRVGGLQ